MQDIGSFIINHWILFLALFTILALLAASYFTDRLLGFKDLAPPEATRMINQQNAVIVDVREEKEFKEGHIVNAVHIPLSQFEPQIKKLEKARGKPLIVTCDNGQRSARAAALLRKQGFEQVFKLGGGLQAWRGANYPLSAK